MAAAFSRSLRSLENDGLGRWLAFGAPALIVLGAWCTWFVRARVPVFADSHEARVVTDRALYPIEAPVAGRVTSVHAALDQQVAAGELLFEIDSDSERLAQREEEVRANGLEVQIASTRAQISAEERALADVRASEDPERRGALLEKDSLAVSVTIAGDEAERLARLRTSGGSTELDVSKARAAADKAKIALAQQDIAVERLALDQRRRASEHEALIEDLRRKLAEEEGARASAQAAFARIAHEIERRSVRAPAAGTVAEFARVRPGSVVAQGERVGAVVSSGKLVVEALFAPFAVLGRVHAGQHGDLRLDGFPWVEYGALEVEVERVASEARDGKIRVELALCASDRARVALEHGLPGSVQIEVERASPFELVLRAAGRTLAPPALETRAGAAR